MNIKNLLSDAIKLDQNEIQFKAKISNVLQESKLIESELLVQMLVTLPH